MISMIYSLCLPSAVLTLWVSPGWPRNQYQTCLWRSAFKILGIELYC